MARNITAEQTAIGGANAPLNDPTLLINDAGVGPILGSTLALEDELVTKLRINLATNNEIAVSHLIAFVRSRTANDVKYEKMLTRIFIPIATQQQTNHGVTFQRTDNLQLPHVGHVVKNVGNRDFIVQGHLIALNSFTPIQVINVCVHCPKYVIDHCCYLSNGKYWRISNIKELLMVIIRQKVTLFNNNEVIKYKNQNRQLFQNARRNNQNAINQRSIPAMIPRVSMRMEFSTEAAGVVDSREITNQVGRLGYVTQNDINAGTNVVRSFAARRNGNACVIIDYTGPDYSAGLANINNDPGLSHMTPPVWTTLAVHRSDGAAIGNGAPPARIIPFDYQTADYGDTTVGAGAASFPVMGPNGVQIPQGVLGFNGRFADNTAISDNHLKEMYASIPVRFDRNATVNINF